MLVSKSEQARQTGTTRLEIDWTHTRGSQQNERTADPVPLFGQPNPLFKQTQIVIDTVLGLSLPLSHLREAQPTCVVYAALVPRFSRNSRRKLNRFTSPARLLLHAVGKSDQQFLRIYIIPVLYHVRGIQAKAIVG